MTRAIPDKAIKYDLASEMGVEAKLDECAEWMEAGESLTPRKRAERCIYQFIQLLGEQLLEQEYGCRFLGMGDGMFMPEPAAKRLSDMASAYERASGMSAGTAETQSGSGRKPASPAPKGDAQ